MLVELLPVLLLAVAVHVEGDNTCPRPDQVAAHLGELLAEADAGAQKGAEKGGENGAQKGAADRARLSEHGAELVVLLEGPAGDVVGTRRFSRSDACEDLAAAIAVSLAVWLGDQHPSYPTAHLAPLPRLALPTADVQAVAASPAPRPGTTWGAGLALGLGSALDAPAAVADGVATAWLRLGRSRNACAPRRRRSLAAS